MVCQKWWLRSYSENRMGVSDQLLVLRLLWFCKLTHNWVWKGIHLIWLPVGHIHPASNKSKSRKTHELKTHKNYTSLNWKRVQYGQQKMTEVIWQPMAMNENVWNNGGNLEEKNHSSLWPKTIGSDPFKITKKIKGFFFKGTQFLFNSFVNFKGSLILV